MRAAVLLFALAACATPAVSPDVGGSPSDGGFVVFDGGTDPETADAAVADVPDAPDASPPPVLQDWYRDSIGYELFVRSFQDSDGDGIGDLRGTIDRLDELSALGVDLLWLMPIAKGSTWHGYEVTDHRDIDPQYGTLEDLDQLLQAAHQRGMRVILDHVINHTSSEHPWFADAQHLDWYVWRDSNPGWSQPWSNNPAWHERDGRWYYGVFSTRMPDLDYSNLEVRAEMLDVAAFWLGRGVDGFRLDGARYLVETGPGPLQSDTEETHRFWREFRGACDRASTAPLVVGEVWAENEIVSRYYGDADQPELHMTFDFDSSYSIADSLRDGSGARAKATLEKRLAQLPAWAESGTFLSNHDQPRVATSLANVDAASLRLAAAVMLTWPGTPWLYYGEEIGMTNGPNNNGYETRLPMQWSDGPGAGFTTGSPWAAPASTSRARSVEGQAADPGSLYMHYRGLIQLRHEHAALRRGVTRIVAASGSVSEPLVIARELEGETLLVVYNFATSPNAISIAAAGLPPSLRFVALPSGSEVLRPNAAEPLSFTVEPRGFRVLRAEAE